MKLKYKELLHISKNNFEIGTGSPKFAPNANMSSNSATYIIHTYVAYIYKTIHIINYNMYVRIYRYSCDEGMTWSDFDFINRPIVVWGIITEPGETTTQVL